MSEAGSRAGQSRKDEQPLPRPLRPGPSYDITSENLRNQFSSKGEGAEAESPVSGRPCFANGLAWHNTTDIEQILRKPGS